MPEPVQEADRAGLTASFRRFPITPLRVAIVALAWLAGSSADAFAHPGSGIVVDRAGRVYFIGRDSKIMRIDQQRRMTVFVADDRIRIPHHLVIDSADNIYTVSDDDGRVWRISPDAGLTLVYEPRGPDAPRVGAWGDPFTIDSRGAIYFVPQGRACARCPLGSAPLRKPLVFRMAADGTGPYGDTSAVFADLHSSTMAWGPDGDLYVSDRTRVVRIARDGTVSAVSADRQLDLEFAMGVAVSAEGTLYVADYVANEVVRIPTAGPVERHGRGRLLRPSGVTVGPDGSMYVVDGRVWRMSPEGRLSLFGCAGALPWVAELAIVIGGPLLLAVWLWVKRSNPFKDRLALLAIVSLAMVPLWHVGRGGCTDSTLRHAAYALVAVAAAASIAGFRARRGPLPGAA